MSGGAPPPPHARPVSGAPRPSPYAPVSGAPPPPQRTRPVSATPLTRPPGAPPRAEGFATGPATDAPPRQATPSVAGYGLRLPKKHTKRWSALLASLGVLVLLVVCGLSSYFIMVDERAGTEARDNGPAPTAIPRDITTREADPKPLTAQEVFPTKQILIDPSQPPYQVLRTSASQDCKTAVSGELATQLQAAKCNQVVRGTLKSPTGTYLVTGGLFNLADEAAADKVHDAVKPLIDAKKGRFSGLVAGTGTESIVKSSTHLGWDVRGHYLIYCVIARTDGKDIAPADPYAKQIIYDIIELHLRSTVLEKRAMVPVTPSAGPPSPSTRPNATPTG